MPHTPQDALLAAVLRALDAERDESGKIIDPDPVRADIEKIIAHGTAQKHDEASSQVSIFTGRTPSQGGSIPKFAEEDTQAAQHLGNFYAHLLDSLELAGKNVDLMADALSNDIEEYGYRLTRGKDGWTAEQGTYEEYVEPGFTGESKDRRGYRICYKDGKRVSCGHRDKGIMSAQRVAARKARTPDLGSLDNRLKVHAASHPINRHEKHRAGLALNLLKRHHGELAAHRLEELADGLERALGAVPEQRKAMVSKQLAMLHAMIGMVGEKAKGGDNKVLSSVPSIDELLKGRKIPRELIDRLTKRQILNADSMRQRLGKKPLGLDGYELKVIPLDTVKPSQQGEDYDNTSSRDQAEDISRFNPDRRPEDYAPIVVDEDGVIVDGNHRHAAHSIAGEKNILALVPKDAAGFVANSGQGNKPADPGRGGTGAGGLSKPEDAPGFTGVAANGVRYVDGVAQKGEDDRAGTEIQPQHKQAERLNSLEESTRKKLATIARPANERYGKMTTDDLKEAHRNLSQSVATATQGTKKGMPGDPAHDQAVSNLAKFKPRLDEADSELKRRIELARTLSRLRSIKASRESGNLTMSEGEMRELLAQAGDVYRDAGVRPTGGRYPHSPDLFRTSDLTGAKIRRYVTLPDGRIAHPDELHLARQRGRLAVVPDSERPGDFATALYAGSSALAKASQGHDESLAEARFTGTDPLGREWRDGKLVAKGEEAKGGQGEGSATGTTKPIKATPEEMVNAARDYIYFAVKDEPEERAASRAHQQHTKKSAVDKWLMERFGLDAVDARAISNKAGEDPAWYTSGGHTMWRSSTGRPEPSREGMNLPWHGNNPKPPEPGYTGIDPQGREWRDGKLVAKGEEAKGDFALTPVIAKGYHDNSLRQARLEATDARSTYAVSKDIVERTDAGSRTYLQDYTMQAINKLRSQLPSLKDDAERAEDHYQLLRKGFLANPARHETAILEQLEDTPNGLTADDAGYLVGLPSGDADALLRQLATDGEIYAHKGVSPSGTVYSLAKKKPRNYAPVQKDDDTKQASKDATAPLESQNQPQPPTGGLEDLPSQVRSTVTWAANKIKDRHDAIAQGKMLDQKLRGEGRYEQEVRDKTPPSRDAEAKLREFISLASDNGIDPRKVMGELGLTEEHLADYPGLAQQGINPTAPEPPEAIDTRMKSMDPRAYAEALKAMSPQDREAYLERKKAAAVEGQKRARAGGEIGPNGEWYPGGAYIATTEMPKMVRQRLEQSASGSVQVSPGNFEVPEAGKLAIFHILGPGVALDPRKMELNDASITYYGGDREVLQGLLDRYKKGERWVQANDFPSLASAADASRLLVAGKPVPGEMLKHLAPAIRERLEKFKPKAAAHQGGGKPAETPPEAKPETAGVESKPAPASGSDTGTSGSDFSQTEQEAADFISKIGTPLSGKPGWYHQTLYRLYTNDDVADLVIKHKDLDNKIFDAKTLDDWATVADRAEQAGFPPTLIKATRAVVEHLGPKSTVSTRKVNTRHGEKTVHSYPAPKKFWDFWKTADKSKLPSNVSPQKDQLTGEWEVAIWGTDEKDVYKSLDQLSSLGLARHYKPAAPSGSTPAQFSEPLADLLASLPPAGYRSVLLSLPAGTRRAYLSHKRKSAVRKFAESRR